MSIPARSNKWGYHETRVPWLDKVEKYSVRDGYVYETNLWTYYTTEQNQYRASSAGDQPTNNAPTLIPGTSTMWRAPSSYGRGVATNEQTMGTWVATGPTVITTWESKIMTDIYWTQQPRMFSVSGPGVIWSSELESQALAQAIGKIKDQKAGLAQNLAEAKKTYNSLMDLGHTLLRSLLAAKRGNLRGAFQVLKGENKSFAKQGVNQYLGNQYGWRPIMNDIYGLNELFRAQLNKALIISAASKSRKETLFIPSTPYFDHAGSGSRQAYCKLYGRLDDTYRHLGDQMGLSNPLSLAWELVPWSFVVDWFIPVGKTLDAFQAPAGVEFLGGFTTQRGEISVTSRALPYGGYEEKSPRLQTYNGFGMERRAYPKGTWPKPGFYTVNPFSGNKHGANAIALLLQKLLR
jgi:hypothetical protein